MVVSNILDVLAAQGRFKTDRLLFESSLYYHGAMVMGIANLVKDDLSRINYYGISFAGSGYGKDFSHNLVGKMFDINDTDYRVNGQKRLQGNCAMSYEPAELEKLINSLPLSAKIGLDGTKEGLFSVSRSQSMSRYGSLNMNHPEIGDIVRASSDLLALLKEAYDGEILAKIIKSENVKGVKDLCANLMAFGSGAGMGTEEREIFYKLASSGIYRRSFIIDIKRKKTEKNNGMVDTTAVHEYLHGLYLIAETFNESQFVANGHNITDFAFTISEAANDELNTVADYLLAKADEDIYNDIQAAERGAIEMIKNLSYIICFLEDRKLVEAKDVSAAFDFYKRCRATTQDIFEIKRPYKLMHDMIMRRQGISMSEMLAIHTDLPSSKAKIADEIALLEEMCYINGTVLHRAGTKVERFTIVSPPENDNTKLIVSVCVEDKGNQSVNYTAMEVPLFGENNSMEALVKSTEPNSFTLAHYEPSKAAPSGHRRAESFISGQNVIGFDIDDSMTVKEAIALLKPYTYLIYTTKSHQKEKNGKVLDRFRIILPTKTTFYVDDEQHKELYDNVAEVLGIQIYDRQTRNVSRFWFTSKSCEIYTNIAENIDVTATMPETKAQKKFIENMDTLAASFDDRTQASVTGFMRWFFANTAEGNRSDHLFRLGKFMLDLGEDAAKLMSEWNAMLDVPLKESELKTTIKSVLK